RVERLAGLVVQDEGEAVRGIALDPRHDPGRVLDLDLGAILAQREARAPVRPHRHGAGIEPTDGVVGDRLAVAVPAAVLAEADAPGVDRGETRARHLRRLAARPCRGAA